MSSHTATNTGGIKHWAYKYGGERALKVVKGLELELKTLHEKEGSQVLQHEKGMIGGAFNAWVRAGCKVPREGHEEDLMEGDMEVVVEMVVEMVNLMALRKLLEMEREEKMGEEQLRELEAWEFIDGWTQETMILAFRAAKSQKGILCNTEPDVELA